MLSYEVVIVGGGVVGASVAYHLAARGCRDVLVVERGARAGEGSTGRATGGFRAQFGTEVCVRLSLLSREKLLRFEDELGVDAGYRPRGYLFLAKSKVLLDALLAAQALQHACGLEEARAVSAEEAREINPAADVEGVVGGVFCPTDGFIRPLEILRGYVEGAARLGVRFVRGARVGSFGREKSERVSSVMVGNEEIKARVFVNAAGAWAGEVGRLAGVAVPVRPLRRQVALTRPFGQLPEEMPMTIWADDGFHLRVRDGRVLLLMPDEPRGADPFDTTVEDEWVKQVFRVAGERVPCLKGAEVERAACWAGLYEMSPDRHALLGAAPEAENFYLANGSSGHGVMHAPALGHLLAEIILDGRATTLDTRALRPTRFAEGEPNVGPEFL
ncbi:MAG TPA: FAD-binding oxidoreductase [Pyrinomonadaceae bacterium]|jgi:sarcosine oxidase subunit beta|nr:FAD-binding oxidoreductase [Pyrinomonadaceae bacterium]